jgi:predicted nucleic acid-binding protein
MTSIAPHRVVLDTNVVIGAGSRWLASEPPQPATAVQRLVHWVACRHTGLFCREILAEYVELMLRRNHPPERISRYVAYLASLFTCINVTSSSCHTAPEDPDDLVFVLCALDGNADLLVSDDRHLLQLQKAYHPRPAIIRPVEASLRLSVPGLNQAVAQAAPTP